MLIVYPLVALPFHYLMDDKRIALAAATIVGTIIYRATYDLYRWVKK